MRGENIKYVVADASWWLAFFYPDEKNVRVQAETDVLLKDISVKFLGISLLPFEIGNSLVTSLKRKRLNELAVGVIWDNFNIIKIGYERVVWNEVLTVAVENSLTFYDSGYVWLALTKKAELLTLDDKMKQVWQKLSKS